MINDPSFYIENFEELKRFVENREDDNEELVKKYIHLLDDRNVDSLLDFFLSLLLFYKRCQKLSSEQPSKNNPEHIALLFWYWHKSNLRNEKQAFDLPTSLKCKVIEGFKSNRPIDKHEFKVGENYLAYFNLSLIPIIMTRGQENHKLTSKEFTTHFAASDLSENLLELCDALKGDFDKFYDAFCRGHNLKMNLEKSVEKVMIQQPLYFNVSDEMETVIDGLKVIELPYYLIRFLYENLDNLRIEDGDFRPFITDFMRTIMPHITQTMF